MTGHSILELRNPSSSLFSVALNDQRHIVRLCFCVIVSEVVCSVFEPHSSRFVVPNESYYPNQEANSGPQSYLQSATGPLNVLNTFDSPKRITGTPQIRQSQRSSSASLLHSLFPTLDFVVETLSIHTTLLTAPLFYV